jgi:molybdopterin-guanine dinucleotide biosynthesis protein B
MRVLGIVGWSGSGKTTLLSGILPLLRARGLSVSTVKHAHKGFDLDRPGKDSYRHREAGAHEVMVVGARRFALMAELPCEEFPLEGLLRRMAPVDLVLVEGFKSYPFTKLEVYRPSLGKPPIWPAEPNVIGVATDEKLTGCNRAVLDLNAHVSVTEWVLARFASLTELRALLSEA